MLRLLQLQYDKLVTAMERESVAKLIRQQQHDFDAGGKKVVQRFLGKLAPIPSLWGVLPRAERRQYPWVLTVRGAAHARFMEWVGAGFEEAVKKGVQLHCSNTFHLRQGHQLIQVFDYGTEHRFGVLPVQDITTFLRTAGDIPKGCIDVGTNPAQAIFTNAVDKLAQLEVYYAAENMDSNGTCRHCHGTRADCTPLSEEREGGREIS
eukprot:3935795-Rhodomonas_salina.1